MRWSPQSLAIAAAGRLVKTGSRPVAAAFIDSRRPRPGALFVPILAARDGHDFIPAALEAGASATLVGPGRGAELPPGEFSVVEVGDPLAALTSLARDARSRIPGPVVAITGSNGKTTTRAFVEAALATAHAQLCCTQGNFNNHLGLPLTLVDAPHEPSAAVLELGMSAPGENDHLASVAAPSIHVITSIALEHLEFMGSIEAIAAAEAEPLAHLRPGGGHRPLAILPGDEPTLVAHLPSDAGDRPRPRVLRFGRPQAAIGGPLDIEIVHVEVGARTQATLRLGARGGEELRLSLRTFGAHNARNAAVAVAVALHLELPLGPVVEALESVEPVGDRGRLHPCRVGAHEHLLIADCYNANPGSMTAALDSLAMLRRQRPGPLVAVLGDMLELGPDEAELHAGVGAHAAALGLDAVLGFGPLARSIVSAAQGAGVPALALDADAVDDAAGWIRAHLDGAQGPGAALFKASRGIRLERVISALVEDAAV